MNRPAKSAAYVARTRPVVPPIYQSVTFYLDDVVYKDIQGNGGLTEHWYSRFATRLSKQRRRRSPNWKARKRR